MTLNKLDNDNSIEELANLSAKASVHYGSSVGIEYIVQATVQVKLNYKGTST